MRLTYDRVARKTHNSPGVEIKLPEWGRTEDIERIGEKPNFSYFDFGEYFNHVADALVKYGYVRGETLFGAPYDFRRGPSKLTLSLYYFLSSICYSILNYE